MSSCFVILGSFAIGQSSHDVSEMNYFAHALPFLDGDPYFAVSTGVPDWLMVVDRRVRIRMKHARAFVDAPDPQLAAVARGTLQHIRDDFRFHKSRAFFELSLAIAADARKVLGREDDFRSGFLGHLLVEVLLDASLTAAAPDRLEDYYRLLKSVDPQAIQAAVNRIAPEGTKRLAALISEFCRLRILSDYQDDGKLWWRLNQVMRRVRLPELPEAICGILPAARRQIDARRDELLEGIPASPERRPSN